MDKIILKEENIKSSKYPKNKKELGECREYIFNDKKYDDCIIDTSDYSDGNAFSEMVSGIVNLVGISGGVKQQVINNNKTQIKAGMFTTSNRALEQSHIYHPGGAQIGVQAIGQCYQRVVPNYLFGQKALFTDEVSQYIIATDEIQSASSMNSSLRINNPNYNYTSLNNYLSFIGNKKGALEKISFVYELLKILLLYNEDVVYPGGINLLYASESTTANLTVREITPAGTYFPWSRVAIADPNINFFATTLGKLSTNLEPNNMTIVPIRKEDISNEEANNAWICVYLEHPIIELTARVTLSVENTNRFTTFGNCTHVKGENYNILFVIVDEDNPTVNLSINCGNGRSVSTITNTPFALIPVPVAIPVGLEIYRPPPGIHPKINHAWLRWCKYFYNSADVEYAVTLAALVMHKAPLIQAFAQDTGIGTLNQSWGISDSDNPLRRNLLVDGVDEADASPCRLNIGSYNLWVDALLQRIEGGEEGKYGEYVVPYTSNRLRILAARKFISGYGRANKIGERIDVIYYKTITKANNILVCSDLSRMSSSKPSNLELLQPFTLGVTIQDQQDYYPVFLQGANDLLSINIGESYNCELRYNIDDFSLSADGATISNVNMDCGGLANLLLFPDLFEHFINHNFELDIIGENLMYWNGKLGAIQIRKEYSYENQLFGSTNAEVEIFHDSYYFQLLFRFQQGVLSGITTKTKDDVNVANQLTAYVSGLNQPRLWYRIFSRRIYNTMFDTMDVKKFIMNFFQFYQTQSLTYNYFNRDDWTKTNVKSLRKNTSVILDEMSSMRFIKKIPDIKK